jgi:hypothetical protein
MISILGCSGVGKSTVINELLKLNNDSCVYSENVSAILNPISQISFNRPYDKFLAIQKTFIERDIKALESLDPSLCNIFDNRLSEYVFYLLHHPEFSRYEEESNEKLKHQIDRVLNTQGLKAFYLSDDILNIENRVKNDPIRSRGSWPYFIQNMYPFHESWHTSHGATVINVKGRESAEVAKAIYEAL